MFAPPNVANTKTAQAIQATVPLPIPSSKVTPVSTPSTSLKTFSSISETELLRRKSEIPQSSPPAQEESEFNENLQKTYETPLISVSDDGSPPKNLSSSPERTEQPEQTEGITGDQSVTTFPSNASPTVPATKHIRPTSSPFPLTHSPTVDPYKKKHKKNKKSAWYNLISPPYRSKCEDFRRLFKDVPEGEMLVVDYSCALQRDILVHGRLYVTQNHLCFYANIFKWETTVVIKCRDITSMTKEKTALVIPNAIQCSTETGEKYFFTSFAARDKTYLMLFRIWQNALLSQPMSTSECWKWIHYSYGDELGLSSEDDDPLYGSSRKKLESEIAVEEGELAQPDSSRCSPASAQRSPISIDDSRSSSSDEAEQDESIFTCDHKHSETTLYLDQVFKMDVDHTFTCLFTASEFFEDFQNNIRKAYNLESKNWERIEGVYKQQRELNYWLPLNLPLAKSCSVNEVQKLLKRSKAGRFYSILSVCNNGNVPYADSYFMEAHYCLTSEGPNCCRLKYFNKLIFRKAPWGWMKSMFEKTAFQGSSTFATDLKNALEKEETRYLNDASPTSVTATEEKIAQPALTHESDTKETNEKNRFPIREFVPSRNSIVYVVCVVLFLSNLYLLWAQYSANERMETFDSSDPLITRSEKQWRQLYSQKEMQHKRQLETLHKLVERTLVGLDNMRDSYKSLLEVIANGLPVQSPAKTLREKEL